MPGWVKKRSQAMRGDDIKQGAIFSYKSMEDRIPADHPIRPLRDLADSVLIKLSPEFDKLYAKQGRPSIAPERLLRAQLLQVLFTVRSERQLVEQLDYNILYRWFVGLGMDDPVWDHSVYSKNRERLLDGDIARKFFDGVLMLAKERNLMSSEHFTVDGTLIEAWASHKSFIPKDDDNNPSVGGTGSSSEIPARIDGNFQGRNADINFAGQKRSNTTHQSTTDPDARLYRKSKQAGAQLCYMGHVLMENRNGLAVDVRLTRAVGHAEEEAAKEMILDQKQTTKRITLGADKAYDTVDFVTTLKDHGITPHIAQNITWNKKTAIDSRTSRHEGYKISQRKRKLVEEIFGWAKTIGGFGKTRHKGAPLVDWMYTFTIAAYNLLRVRNLLAAYG
jgi:transposase